MPLLGNPQIVLQELADWTEADGLLSGAARRTAFLDKILSAGPRVYSEEDTRSDAIPMHPARVVTELRNAYPDNGLLAVDSGAQRAWFAEYWQIRQIDTHFSLTNLGPMGGAIPLAIGAKLARPAQPMLVATGDGCMLMHGMELHTAAREKIPMVIAVMNNHAYGNIYYRAHQMGPGPQRLTDIPNTDWVAFATAMGARGERVDTPEAIGEAMERALAADGPYLLDLHVDKTYPTPVGVWKQRQQEWEDND